MDNLENKIDEVKFEDYVMQYDDFRKEFTPLILGEMEERGYMLEVCVLGLSQIIEAMIDMYVTDEKVNKNIKKECINVIENGLKNAKKMESEVKESSEPEE